MKAGGQYGDCLPIISVSHPWQQPDNPDPKGVNLKILAEACQCFLEGGYPGPRNYAVFFDFCSLYQWPRSDNQDKLFGFALQTMLTWWVHTPRLTHRPHRCRRPQPHNLALAPPHTASHRFEDRSRLPEQLGI